MNFFKSAVVALALCVPVSAVALLYSPPAAAQQVIESRIDGEFNGWEGETVVKLQNGQIWVQTQYHYHYHYSYSPKVIVYQSNGGWKMQVEGSDQPVGVRQLR
ncbi:hypothetical protein [Lysobacter sp. HA35]